MKKLSLYVLAAFMMFAVIPAQLHAATNPSPTAIAATKPAESEIADALNLRLMEINELDKANLSTTEKKELRKEVRTIKSELKALNGGVYLSVGAILIIILLLILLL